MGYEKRNYETVEPAAPEMYRLRDALNCENLGITVMTPFAGWEGKPHDHAGDGQEEVYLLIEGAGAITVDGEKVALDPGDAVRVDADSHRELSFAEQSTMVVVGAP
jgi:mannose-6-phosphate isomerase-like protein (cupin superfamily)